MAIVALPLFNCLRTLRKSNPKRNDIDPMLNSIKQHINFRRGPYSPCPQMQMWTASHGGLKMAVKMASQSLINWSLQVTTMNPAQLPPPYNQRLFWIAERILGAPALLSVILAELKEQTDNPAGAAAVTIDIATAIICAPKMENSPIDINWPTSAVAAQHPHQSKRLNLREALALENDRAIEIMKKDQTMAETIVRLHRRVEAQCAIGSTPLPDLAAELPQQDMQQMLDLANQQSANAVQQQPTLDLTQETALADLGVGASDAMQLDFSGTGGDDGMGGLLGTGPGGIDADDDVFGDLDLSTMDGMDVDYGF
jgi:mediator of RNA polymerase II transcription subunit 5